MANKKKKTVVEEIVKEDTIEETIGDKPVEEVIEENAAEEAVEENIAEEAIEENAVEETEIESDEGKNEDSSDEGEPEKIDEDVIVEDEPEIIQIVKVPTEDNTIVYRQKDICKVVLATPSYYIINKNGSNVTIYGKNDKKRGDTVEY